MSDYVLFWFADEYRLLYPAAAAGTGRGSQKSVLPLLLDGIKYLKMNPDRDFQPIRPRDNQGIKAYRVAQDYQQNLAGARCDAGIDQVTMDPRTFNQGNRVNWLDVPYRAIWLVYGPQKNGLVNQLGLVKILPVCTP